MSVGIDPIGRGLVRQGDLLLVPVVALPEDARQLGSGRLVLLRGEATGHAHVVEDEHDSLSLLPGVYEVRRQREYVPLRRARWVAD